LAILPARMDLNDDGMERPGNVAWVSRQTAASELHRQRTGPGGRSRSRSAPTRSTLADRRPKQPARRAMDGAGRTAPAHPEAVRVRARGLRTQAARDAPAPAACRTSAPGTNAASEEARPWLRDRSWSPERTRHSGRVGPNVLEHGASTSGRGRARLEREL